MRSCFDWAVKFGKEHPKSIRISKVLLSALPAGGVVQEVVKLLTEYTLESVEDLAEEEQLTQLIDQKLSEQRAISGDQLKQYRSEILSYLDSVLGDVTRDLENFERQLQGVQASQLGMSKDISDLREQSAKIESKLDDQLKEMKRNIELQNQKLSAFGHQQDQLFKQQSDQAVMISTLRESLSSPESAELISVEMIAADAESAISSQQYKKALSLYTQLESRTGLAKYNLFKVVAFLMVNHYESLNSQQGDDIWDALKAVTKDAFCKTAALVLLCEMKESFYDARHLSVRFPPLEIVRQTIKANPPPHEILKVIGILASRAKYSI